MHSILRSTVKLIPLSFFAIIALGTILLLLPVSTMPGEETGIITALFTATTSVCVTGLVVVDTYAHWSMFGQTVILFLMQIGGLGVVAVGSMILLIGRKKFYLGDRKLLGDSLNIEKNKGLLRTLVRIFKGVAIVEGISVLLFATQFIPAFGFARGLWISVFHTVSAFCNAGMDVIGPNSLESYSSSGFILCLTMLLIVLGGIGFVVWFDIVDGIRDGFKNRLDPKRIFIHFPEHCRLVIYMTAGLILLGALCIFLSEYRNPETLGAMSLQDRILNSFFQSVTFRTAGFATIPQDKLTGLSCMAGYVLMFIGGSPVGTAGGIKTVTAFLFFMNALSYIRGRKEDVVFHRSISPDLMRKASAIVFVSAVTVFVMTFALIATDTLPLTDALYEVVSALGTVGLSRSVTPHLTGWGRLIIIGSMFLGRIGPISMAIFFAKDNSFENRIRHAEGNFYVG